MSKKVLIVCTMGSKTGLGHFTRCSSLMNHVQNKRIKCSLLKLEDFKKNYNENFINQKIKIFKPDLIIFDLGKKFLKPRFLNLLKELKREKYKLIGIDNLKSCYPYLDLVWVPSFFLEKKFKKKNVVYGWDKFLLKKSNHRYKIKKKIYILTGASKNNFLPNILPSLIEKKIPKKFKLIWVKGKYSKKPNLNFKSDRWKILDKSKSYLSYLPDAGYVLTTYGMSFYESLSLGIPTVCFPVGQNKKKDYLEFQKLKRLNVSILKSNYRSAINELNKLTFNKKKALLLSRKSKLKFDKNGLDSFKSFLAKLI